MVRPSSSYVDKEKGNEASTKERGFGLITEFSRKHFQSFCFPFCVITKSSRRDGDLCDADS